MLRNERRVLIFQRGSMSTLDALVEARDFTDTERKLAAYILSHADEVVRMKLATLAQQSHTSNAAVVRLCKKVGSGGYSEFRLDLSQDMERRRNSIRNIDANAPILENQKAPVIMSAIATLSKEAIDDCYAVVSQAAVERAAALVAGAHRVITYAVGDTFLSTEAFANLLEKIGVTCVSSHHNGDVFTVSSLARPDDVGLFVSYSGRLVDDLSMLLDILRKKRCKTIVVTANDQLASKAAGFDAAIILPCRERGEGRNKVATFYSQTCIRYALECVYGVVFAMNYQENLLHKNQAEWGSSSR